jgi:hypothetical protein
MNKMDDKLIAIVLLKILAVIVAIAVGYIQGSNIAYNRKLLKSAFDNESEPVNIHELHTNLVKSGGIWLILLFVIILLSIFFGDLAALTIPSYMLASLIAILLM